MAVNLEDILTYNSNQKLVSKKIPMLLTVKEVAFYLRKSEKTVKRYIYEGKLEVMRVGKSLMIETPEFIKFYKKCKENFE